VAESEATEAEELLLSDAFDWHDRMITATDNNLNKEDKDVMINRL
jgi:hypothetical protein